MMNRFKLTVVTMGALGLLAGCEMMEKFSGPDSGSGSAAPQKQQEDALVNVFLDGHKASPSVSAGMRKIDGAVGTSPKIRYEVVSASKLGPIKNVIINIFRYAGDKPASSADYAIFPKDMNHAAESFKAGVVYDLGAPGGSLSIMGPDNQMVDSVKLKSGQRYWMNFVVSADQSETASIEFTAR